MTDQQIVAIELFVYSCIVAGTNYKDMSKRTYQPSKRKRATTHGFLVRSESPTGRKVLLARRRKGRAQLTVKKAQ